MMLWFALAMAQEVPLALPAGDEVAQDLAFAEYLAERGDVDGAIRLYREAAFEGGERGARAAWRAGELALRADHADEAVYEWVAAAERFPDHADAYRLGEGLGRYRLGQYGSAARGLDRVVDPDLSDAAAVAAALAWAADDQDDQALRSLERVQEARWLPSAEGLRAALALPPPPRRAPALAGVLSTLLPGAGQLYVGRPGEAASAFFVTGGLSAGTALFAVDDKWPGAVVLGLLGLSYWVANVVSAVSGARRFNRLHRHRRREARAAAFAPQVQLADGDALILELSPATEGGR